ncbi:hypothetical protein PLANTIT3_50334 [Plantibacter sp. T3]|nr:hypothetical protein PLANTIT3_50334 [Plantibacter sp. T3]
MERLRDRHQPHRRLGQDAGRHRHGRHPRPGHLVGGEVGRRLPGHPALDRHRCDAVRPVLRHHGRPLARRRGRGGRLQLRSLRQPGGHRGARGLRQRDGRRDARSRPRDRPEAVRLGRPGDADRYASVHRLVQHAELHRMAERGRPLRARRPDAADRGLHPHAAQGREVSTGTTPTGGALIRPARHLPHAQRHAPRSAQNGLMQ